MKIAARTLIYTLIVTTTMICAPSKSWSMLAPAQNAAEGRSADMKMVQNALESKIVRERLKALGLSDKEIESRLGKLTDRELHKLAKDVDTLAAGGFIEALLVVVVLVLLIVFLVHRI